MSSSDKPPEAIADESREQVGGLGEVLPKPLIPVWRRIEKVQSFRRTYGETYVGVLELLTGLVLIGGYLWWLYIYL